MVLGDHFWYFGTDYAHILVHNTSLNKSQLRNQDHHKQTKSGLTYKLFTKKTSISKFTLKNMNQFFLTILKLRRN